MQNTPAKLSVMGDCAKSIVNSLLTPGGQNVKSVHHYTYLGIVLDTEILHYKDINTHRTGLRYIRTWILA